MIQIYASLLRTAAASLLVAMSALVCQALKQATIEQALFWRSLWPFKHNISLPDLFRYLGGLVHSL